MVDKLALHVHSAAAVLQLVLNPLDAVKPGLQLLMSASAAAAPAALPVLLCEGL
jgi:uncharacterized protein (DUF2126 family)